jgi:hypothetical protein
MWSLRNKLTVLYFLCAHTLDFGAAHFDDPERCFLMIKNALFQDHFTSYKCFAIHVLLVTFTPSQYRFDLKVVAKFKSHFLNGYRVDTNFS